jgi:hypothetical protein
VGVGVCGCVGVGVGVGVCIYIYIFIYLFIYLALEGYHVITISLDFNAVNYHNTYLSEKYDPAIPTEKQVQLTAS